jgi:methionyl-tRNA formyltransferase
MLKNLRIVFMGTPDFAVPSLKILVEAGYNIVAVITAPDRPAGRGLQMHVSPVKAYASSVGIPVLQPIKLKDSLFLEELKSYQANLQVVVAFRMLPDAVWQMPGFGTFNLHGSLLPYYRGAAPINRAVMNGEKETGTTTFFLKKDIDTGDIIFQEKAGIGPDEDAGAVHDKLMIIGAKLVLKTVKAIEMENIITFPQILEGEPKAAPKIFKEDCRINWQETNLNGLHDFVRGLSPHPGAWTMLDSKILKIYKTSTEVSETSELAGKIFTDKQHYLKIACRGGFLHILELQLEGRKKIGTEEFLRGYVFKNNMLKD